MSGVQPARARPERDALVLEHLGMLPAVAYRTGATRCQDPALDLDDYLAVGAVGLLEAAAQWDPSKGASFRAFAWRGAAQAMRNQARDLSWRRRATLQPGRQLTSLELVAAPGGRRPAPDPGGGSEASVTRAAVQTAVAALPAGDRALIEAFYFADLDQATIARRLGITPNAVKCRLLAARRRLARSLRPEVA